MHYISLHNRARFRHNSQSAQKSSKNNIIIKKIFIGRHSIKHQNMITHSLFSTFIREWYFEQHTLWIRCNLNKMKVDEERFLWNASSPVLDSLRGSYTFPIEMRMRNAKETDISANIHMESYDIQNLSSSLWDFARKNILHTDHRMKSF